MRINKKFSKGISYSLILSSIFTFFFVFLEFNNYAIRRDEWFHLKLINSSINYESILEILKARIPFTLFAKFLNYISFNIFDSLTVLRISSAFFGILIFTLFSIYKLNINKPLLAIKEMYLYFPFVALLIISLSGQRDGMLSLLTIGLYNLENNSLKALSLVLITLLRPHLSIAYLLGLILTKYNYFKNKIIFFLLPITLGSICVFFITLYFNKFLGLGFVGFSLLKFIETFFYVFGFGFLLAPDSPSLGLENTISIGKEFLFLSRIISPAVFIVPYLSIKKLITKINFRDKNLNKLSLCFSSYLIYTSFCTTFGFSSARQQLPLLLALSFIYKHNKNS